MLQETFIGSLLCARVPAYCCKGYQDAKTRPLSSGSSWSNRGINGSRERLHFLRKVEHLTTVTEVGLEGLVEL